MQDSNDYTGNPYLPEEELSEDERLPKEPDPPVWAGYGYDFEDEEPEDDQSNSKAKADNQQKRRPERPRKPTESTREKAYRGGN